MPVPPSERTRVVHVRFEPYDVLISRPSPWGNPFVIGIDGDRDDVCDKHIEHIAERPDLLRRIGELRGRRLGCYCKAPGHEMRCHGDHLELLAELVG